MLLTTPSDLKRSLCLFQVAGRSDVVCEEHRIQSMCTWVQILAAALTCSVRLCKFHMLSVPLTHRTVVKVKLVKTHKILEIVSGTKHGLIVC